MEREARLKKERGQDVSDEFVREAQRRVEEEARQNYSAFAFKTWDEGRGGGGEEIVERKY